MSADGVVLDLAEKKRPPSCLSFKRLLLLFFIFLLVVSNVFVDNVIGKFRGATVARNPTGGGTVLQGVMLVLGFIAVNKLIEVGVIP